MANVMRAAFDQGQVPTIACINKSTVSLGVDLEALVAALQKFVGRSLCAGSGKLTPR